MPISNDISELDPSTPATRCKTLDLNVNDGKVQWLVRVSNLAGIGYPGDWHPAVLHLEDDQRESIELFASLLRLLVDVSPKGDAQRLVVEGTLLSLVRRLGELLYSVLFSDQKLRMELTDSMMAIRKNKLELLRIELEFSGTSVDLASWPWEYLRSPEDLHQEGSGEFLMQTARLVLNRTMSSRFRDDFSTRKPVLLLVVSRPRAEGPVEGSEVEMKIQSLHDSGQVVLHRLVEPEPGDLLDEDYEPTASWVAFGDAVRRCKPNIIHFIGHGRLSFDPAQRKEIGQLAFVNSKGAVDWKSESEFAREVVGSNLRLVFLQACESAHADPRANISGVAMRLAHQSVPAVIAMQSKVQNRIANEFAVRFYEMLSNGVPIDWAVKEARDQVGRMEGPTESEKLAFGMPVVYLQNYGGLIDRSVGGGEVPGGNGSGTTSPEHPLLPTVEVCPNCNNRLKEAARLRTFCPDCGLQLRCNKCLEPLDVPRRDGCYCGTCRNRIEPLEVIDTVKRILPQTDSARETQPPSGPKVVPDLGADLRMKYPFKSPSGGGRSTDV